MNEENNPTTQNKSDDDTIKSNVVAEDSAQDASPQTSDIQPEQTPSTDRQSQNSNLNDNLESTNKPKAKSKKKILIIVGIILIGIVVAGILAYVLMSKNNKPKNDIASTSNSESSDKGQKSSNIAQDVKFSEMKEIAYQPVLTDEGLKSFYGGDITELKKEIKFYNIGTFKGNELIMAKLPPRDMDGAYYTLLTKHENKYTLLLSYSDIYQDGKYNGPDYAAGTETDSTTTFPELEVKKSISYNGVSATLVPNSTPDFIDNTDKNTKLTEVAKVGQSTVYEQVATNDTDNPGVKLMSIVLKQPTGMYLYYHYSTDVLKDDNSIDIKFANNKTTTEKYNWVMISHGCGILDAVNVVDKAYFKDLVEIGKSGSEPIYGFKSANNQVVSTLYKAYNLDGQRDDAVSQEQFWKDNGVVVVKNKLGYRVILVNEKYQRQGECGKPVIYLYPQEKTDLSVKVGADVTVSDPAYNTGWDVTANPDGQIFNKKDGKTYPYLFWEGQGHGKYPKITEGFVVKQSQVEQTLWSHLALLGLNQQESKDFMEFWLPKVPKSPYVRLTWFNTRQMDRLAPLSLSVKPDTSIRIFIDFQGLDKPINLKPQTLTYKPRQGFVLVEWGGLLNK